MPHLRSRRLPCLAFAVFCACLPACGDDVTEPADDDGPGLDLPQEIGGVALEPISVSGTELVDTTAAWADALATLGVSAADLSLAVAAAPDSAALSLQVMRLTARGVDWTTRLVAFSQELADHGVALEPAVVSQRDVWVADDASSDHVVYYHAVGDALFTVWTDDRSAAQEVFASVGGVSAASSSPHSAQPRAGRAPSSPMQGPLLISVLELPRPPVCVAEPPGRQRLIATTMIGFEAGLFPDPFVLVTPIAPWSTLLPATSVGFHHAFLYASTAFAAGEADDVRLEAISTTTGLSATQGQKFEVQHCLNGTWEDGPRMLRIAQTLDEVTATIEEGTLICGATGIAFSGTLDQEGPIAMMEGSDLMVCNPPECVAEGLLEQTALVSYQMSVADDGMTAVFEWTETLFDYTYDDDGVLVGCTPNGTATNSFSIQRLVFGPDRPF